MAETKAQGGLVMLHHGFDPLKRYRLRPEVTGRIAGQIDLVETFKSRLSRHHWNRAATAWVQARGLPLCAGSDAHTLRDIGEAWVETPFRQVRSPTNLRQALAEGTVAGHWTHPVYAYGRKQWRILHGCMDRPPNEWKKSQGAVRRDLIH